MTNITINEDQLPTVGEWKVGKRYKLVIEAELMGLNNLRTFRGYPMMGDIPENKSDKSDKRLSADLEIKSVKEV